MDNMLKGIVYKQLDLLLQSLVVNDENTMNIFYNTMSHIKDLFNDDNLNKTLDDYKQEFENNLVSIEKTTVDHIKNDEEIKTLNDITNYMNKAENDIAEAFNKYISNSKTFIILYIRTVKA